MVFGVWNGKWKGAGSGAEWGLVCGCGVQGGCSMGMPR